MPTLTRFEDLEAWQKARILTRRVYELSDRGRFANDFALRDQIRRACISVLSNIAEGFERSGSREFLQLLAVAKGSAGEVRAQLYVALDQGYLSEQEFDDLSAEVSEVGRLIGGLMGYLRRSGHRGSRFK